MSAVAALKPIDSPSPSLMPHRGRLAQSERNVWRYHPEPKHTLNQVLDPAYWAHVSRQHRVGDKIEARWEDGSAYAELLVVSCGKDYTKVHVLAFHDLTDKSKDDAKFAIQWKGAEKKHCIVRISDSSVIHEGVQTKAEAAAWLEQNRASLA
jgi:hypothetical protein